MKYAIASLIRCDTIEERDALTEKVRAKLKSTFPDDDSFITCHKCYHDEDENKPCETELHLILVDGEIQDVTSKPKAKSVPV